MKPSVAIIGYQPKGSGGLASGSTRNGEAVRRFSEAEGFALTAEFVEAESGKGADALDRRPQLAAALSVACSRKCADGGLVDKSLCTFNVKHGQSRFGFSASREETAHRRGRLVKR